MPHFYNALDHHVVNEYVLEDQQFQITEKELEEAIRLAMEAVTEERFL